MRSEYSKCAEKESFTLESIYSNSLVNFLLDEILGSAVHRCLESVLMEPNAVEIICERG